MRVLLATQKPFAPQAVEGITKILLQSGHEVELLERYEREEELAAALENVNALIVRSDIVGAQTIRKAESLKIIVRAGAGYDNIDLQAASQASIVVMNTPGQNANAVAELTIGMMIFMARNQFAPNTGSELSGKSLGIQGFGNVGSLIASKAIALGMRVRAFDPVKSDEDLLVRGVEPVSNLKSLYSECNFISLNMPLVSVTERSVGYDLLTSMPKNGILINTARKEIMDELGLMRALEERKDLRFAADVAPDNYAQLRDKFTLRVYANPKKIGAQTAEANLNAGLAAARQIVDYFETGNIKYQVNR